MSAFKIQVVAVNPPEESKATPPIEALVDTCSVLAWIPESMLKSIGVTPRNKKSFITATGERIERKIAYLIIRAEGFETIDEVVIAEKGDMSLLGVRTLEGFSVLADNIAHRLVARASLAS